MRRLMLGVIGLAMAVATTGCVAVSAKDNNVQVPEGETQVVAVQGDVYVVNKKTGRVRKIDLSTATAYERPAAGMNDYENSTD